MKFLNSLKNFYPESKCEKCKFKYSSSGGIWCQKCAFLTRIGWSIPSEYN